MSVVVYTSREVGNVIKNVNPGKTPEATSCHSAEIKLVKQRIVILCQSQTRHV